MDGPPAPQALPQNLVSKKSCRKINEMSVICFCIRGITLFIGFCYDFLYSIKNIICLIDSRKENRKDETKFGHTVRSEVNQDHFASIKSPFIIVSQRYLQFISTSPIFIGVYTLIDQVAFWGISNRDIYA